MSRARRWDEDDDDYSPAYRGSRNYEGFGSSIGDTIGDAFDSVKRAASDLKENVEREAKKSDLLDRIGTSMRDIGENVKETTLDLSERVSQEV